MTIQDEYATTARRAQDSWVEATESWTQSAQQAVEQIRFPFVPVNSSDALAAVDQWFDFAERMLEANREYAKNLADVANAWTGAVREHVDSIGGVVRDQVQVVSETARDQVQKLERAEQEQVERAEKAEQEAVREAQRVQRAQAREERQSARERYEGLTKTELSEELAKRDLPKSGNVDELVDRLVEDDTK